VGACAFAMKLSQRRKTRGRGVGKPVKRIKHPYGIALNRPSPPWLICLTAPDNQFDFWTVSWMILGGVYNPP
jgi:hypothetical protein